MRVTRTLRRKGIHKLRLSTGSKKTPKIGKAFKGFGAVKGPPKPKKYY